MNIGIRTNLSWLLFGRLLTMGGAIFIGIWTARYLGPNDFGLLNYALSFVALFGIVGKLTMEPVVVRALLNTPNKEREILGSIFWLKLAGSLVAIALVLPAAYLANPHDSRFFLLVAISAAGIACNGMDAVDAFYQAKVLSKYVVKARTSAFAVLAAVRIGLIIAGFSVVWFSIAATMELALGSTLMAWIYYRKEGGFTGWIWRQATVKRLVRDGWPLIISSLFVVVHTRIDQVMIGQMLDDVQVGIYSAAVRISEAWLFIPVLLAQTLMPYFMNLRESCPELYSRRLLQLYSATFWMGAVVGFMSLVFGRPAIIVLFGDAYSSAAGPLVLMIWTGAFIAQAVARGIWMVAENLQLFRLVNNLFAVPVNIALNWILIPRYGIQGAAVASLLSVGMGTWLIPLMFAPLRASNFDMIRSVNPSHLFVR